MWLCAILLSDILTELYIKEDIQDYRKDFL